ncbi:MAG: beta-N-acetylhexosaminidase [Alphaproteobacteria bacterium]|nr:beta-N-acetylhexosaminidase [Alphaproteobacteria bacterium]
MSLAVVLGLKGPQLSAAEAEFFRAQDPWGFILFARNIETPDQTRDLIARLRACVGRADAPVFVDQEGGRVQRFRPPHWSAYPPGARYAAAARDADEARDLAWLGGRLMAEELFALGVSVDCAPVADVPVAGAHDVIGDRAFSHDPARVADLAGAQAEGLMAGGVLPVVKHIPGHGRAGADSHLALPRVSASLADLAASDFVPFRALANLPMAMTAHVVFEAIDAEAPATTSPAVISRIIRGDIGFDGLLISDDLSMQALSGTLRARAEAARTAGCDMLLHCNGDMAEMVEVVAGAAPLTGAPARRAEAALAARRAPGPFDVAAGRERLDRALKRDPTAAGGVA